MLSWNIVTVDMVVDTAYLTFLGDFHVLQLTVYGIKLDFSILTDRPDVSREWASWATSLARTLRASQRASE